MEVLRGALRGRENTVSRQLSASVPADWIMIGTEVLKSPQAGLIKKFVLLCQSAFFRILYCLIRLIVIYIFKYRNNLI